MRLAALFVCGLLAWGAAREHSVSWKARKLHGEPFQGQIEIVWADGKMPPHWVVSAVPDPALQGEFNVVAMRVQMDGQQIDHVTNLEPAHIQLRPGVIEISGVDEEHGVMVQVGMPSGTTARILHQGLSLGAATQSTMWVDGKINTGVPKPQFALVALLSLLQGVPIRPSAQ